MAEQHWLGNVENSLASVDDAAIAVEAVTEDSTAATVSTVSTTGQAQM